MFFVLLLAKRPSASPANWSSSQEICKGAVAHRYHACISDMEVKTAVRFVRE